MIDYNKRINLLSEETSNKIAAGEVVERPASAVKELIENSIDAGARNISISIEEGGEKSIIISDDGEGIHPDDIKLAFIPHATSKIKEIHDIYNITSLGFRGEALASIAAISKVNLKSKTKDFLEGKEILIEGGNILNFIDTGCSTGTTIEISNIFFNVPARQKFLKSSRRESALISDMVLRMALSHSNISFRFINNGKQVFHTTGNGDLLENIRILYGKQVYENVNFFEGHSDTLSVYGYIGNSEISRGSRNRQSIFVNNRMIQSKLITTSVEKAFKSFLTINKFPFFTIFLDIYPELMDVNVHPNKTEVKFKDERFIFKFIFDSVHHALRESLKNSFNIPMDETDENNNEPIYIDNKCNEFFSDKVQEKFNVQEFIPSNEDIKNIYENRGFKKLNEEESFNKKNIKNFNDFTKENLNSSLNKELKTIKVNLKEAKFPAIKIIGQFDKTYIIGEAFKELYIIDQHAAHEKILFEKYMKEIKNREIIAQTLAIPQIEELTPQEYALYEENREIFFNVGFSIEPFGENTISIREVPLFLGETNVKSLFNDILEDLNNMGKGDETMVRYIKIATLACKAAIKANHTLSLQEMEYLLDDLRFIDDPFTCPHGRPTIIKYTLKDLEKQFKRIQ